MRGVLLVITDTRTKTGVLVEETKVPSIPIKLQRVLFYKVYLKKHFLWKL